MIKTLMKFWSMQTWYSIRVSRLINVAFRISRPIKTDLEKSQDIERDI